MRLILILFAGLLTSCSPLSRSALQKTFVESERQFQNHSGFIIIDPAKNKTLFEYQSDKYFTPASNTKILTFFTGLTILRDSVPALKYVERNDSLIVWGMGDPSFLYEECFNNSRTYNFLASNPRRIFLSSANIYSSHYGQGWAWDDYNDYYSAERSSFPVYGNCFKVYPFPDQVLILPEFFKKHLQLGSAGEKVRLVREVDSNDFTLYPGIEKSFKEFTIPFKTSPVLTAQLLADTLGKQINLADIPFDRTAQIRYSIPVDSLLSVMMKESDNHIAEQVLLMCSAILSDSLNTETAIRYMQENHFYDLPDKLIWRDGSGLSRYNLFTPRSITGVWQKIYSKTDRERLFSLLVTGGEQGTLKNWFQADKPYIFGKTGTLSNNHSLSGYLVTKKGRTLIFAFMNANYVAPVRDIRNNKQRILNLYYENY